MKPGAGVLSHPISPTLQQLAGPTCGPVCNRVEPNPLHEPLKMIPWDSCSSSLGVLLPAPATNKGLCVDNTEQTANKPEAQREPPPYVVGYNGNSRYCGCVYVCVWVCVFFLQRWCQHFKQFDPVLTPAGVCSNIRALLHVGISQLQKWLQNGWEGALATVSSFF